MFAPRPPFCLAVLVLACALTVTTSVRAEPNKEPLTPQRESLTRPLPLGLWVGIGASAAWIERDAYAGVDVGIGLEAERFALHLRVPLWLRPYDFPPTDDASELERLGDVERAVCGVVRCAEWSRDGSVGAAFAQSGTPGSRALRIGTQSLGALSRVLDELRLGDDGDAIFVRGGPLHGHLGTGQLVNNVWGSPVWDERQAGVYARAQLPFAKTTVEVMAPGFLTAYELAGARAAFRPGLFLVGDAREGVSDDALGGAGGGEFLESLGRIEVAGEVVTDLVAPVQGAAVVVGGGALPVSTRPLLGVALEATWDLLPVSWWIQATPLLSTSVQWGLSRSGDDEAAVGAGAGGGARLRFSFPYVGGLVEGIAGVQSASHRAGVFGGLYLLERRHALYGTAAPAFGDVQFGQGIVRVPAPGGVYFRTSGEVVVADLVRMGLRLQLEDAPGANVAEAWADVALWTLRAGARVIRRDIVFDRGAQTMVFSGTTLLALEARWAFWGPFAARARVQRLPRFSRRSLVVDDDFFLGVEAAFVFGLGG